MCSKTSRKKQHRQFSLKIYNSRKAFEAYKNRAEAWFLQASKGVSYANYAVAAAIKKFRHPSIHRCPNEHQSWFKSIIFRVNPKFCVNAELWCKQSKINLKRERRKQLPPCLQNNSVSMACRCLLSNVCLATSFYQSLQTMSSLIPSSFCATYCTLSD